MADDSKRRRSNKHERTRALRRARAALGLLPPYAITLEQAIKVMPPGWKKLAEEAWLAGVDREIAVAPVNYVHAMYFNVDGMKRGSNLYPVLGRITERSRHTCYVCGAACDFRGHHSAPFCDLHKGGLP